MTLSLRDVCKTYPGFELGPLSLDLLPGTAMGLLGPNGAGKTTLLNAIALQSRLTAGAMSCGGSEIQWGDARWKSLQRVLRNLLRERPDVSILLSSHIFEDLETVADSGVRPAWFSG